MGKVLIVTNDFPPRSGGIQSFVHSLATGMAAGSVVVYAPAWPGAAEFDAKQPFPVVRHPTSLMLPAPGVARRARRILTEHGCDTVLFGAAAPLGLLGAGLRKAGATRIVALTHGHEAGWAALPGARFLLRKIGDYADVVTYLGEYFRIRIARGVSPSAAAGMVRLAPGVDNTVFRPGAGGARIRSKLGIATDVPVVVCVSRIVPRKGQDTLILAWPRVLAGLGRQTQQVRSADCRPQNALCQPTPQVRSADERPQNAPRSAVEEPVRPGIGAGLPALDGAPPPSPVLLIVGAGKCAEKLKRLAQHLQVANSVIFAGSVPWEDLPAYYDAGNVFAMPCRTRHAGLDVEGLGIVYLEASATGLPVIGGDSGGAPDAILPGETGYVVKGGDEAELADRLIQLLGDPDAAAAMGDKGLAWIDQEWRWDLVSRRLAEILSDGTSPI